MEFNPVGVFSVICALTITLLVVITSLDDTSRVKAWQAFVCFVATFSGFWLLFSWVFPQ